MKLSSPIHVLKGQAKELKRTESISMREALNKIAQREGYHSWSLLQAKHSDPFPNSYNEVLSFFNDGDLVLIGARPNMGKTSFTIGLLVQAIQQKKAKNYYFTLAEVHRDVAGRIALYDETVGGDNKFLELDYSNDINAEYIINKTRESVSKGSLIIVDYLQLLDEKRTSPGLQEQVVQLREYAREVGCIVIFISQVRREVENQIDKTPTLEDIRLPNPLDLSLLNKVLLLFRKESDSKEVKVIFYRPKEHFFRVRWDRERIKFS